MMHAFYQNKNLNQGSFFSWYVINILLDANLYNEEQWASFMFASEMVTSDTSFF